MSAIWNEINAIGTLLFAAIALFALFYPQLLEKYRSPKFGFEILSYGNEPGKVQSIKIRVTNIGKRAAHGVVGFIEINDPKEKKNLLYGKIPVDEIRISHDGIRMSYDGITVYPKQCCEMLCMVSGNLRIAKPPHLEITSYPYGIGEYIPPLTSLKEFSAKSDMYIHEERRYTATVTAACEELSEPSSYSFDFIYRQGRVEILNKPVTTQ